MMTRNSLTYAVDQAIAAVVFDEFMTEPRLVPELYQMRTSDSASETEGSFGTLGVWDTKQEGQSPPEDQIQQQFKKTFTHDAKAKKVLMSRELIEDQRWGLVEDIGMEIGASAALTFETDGAALFNDIASGVLYKSEDGKSIANAAHTNAQGGNSQSNTGTNTLNFAGLDTTRLAMKAFTNYRGDKMTVIPDELLVPDALEEKSWELVRSVGKPEGANNELNYYNGRFRLYVWHFLTDTNAWFMMDSRMRRRSLRWYQRISVEVFGDGDLFAGSRRMGGYTRYSNGCTDWKWVFFNNPS